MPVAIVTGSSRGIGRGIAIRLANDGFSVVVNDISPQKNDIDQVVAEIQARGQNAYGIVCDVSNEDQVYAMIEETVKIFGSLDVMVANAGVLETTSLLDMKVQQWDRVMSINIRGTFLCYTAAAKQMIKQGTPGRLIAACSISGYRPSGKAPAYCTSKFAVRGLTQTAALEFGQYGITANSYCPAAVKTNMAMEFESRMAKEQGTDDVEAVWKDSPYQKNLLQQKVDPEDIAGLVSFLAGKDGARMTGQSIIYDGGECLLCYVP